MRECGPCRACCVGPEIRHRALTKPACVACPNLSPDPGPAGCTVYETRPKPCREFVCAWAQGAGEEGDRPDLVGVMFMRVAEGHVTAFETRPGGFRRIRAGRLVESVADRLLLVYHDGRREERQNGA